MCERDAGVGQDGGMDCPQCGTELANGRCAVCGYHEGTGVASTTSPALAGWWRRVGATLTDDLILVVPTLLVAGLLGYAGSVAGVLAGVALQGLYMVALVSSSSGQTLGNRVAVTKVRDASTNLGVTRQQALRRWGFIAAYGVVGVVGGPITYLAAVVGLVDVLYPLFDARNQTLHDKFAGTIVVKA